MDNHQEGGPMSILLYAHRHRQCRGGDDGNNGRSKKYKLVKSLCCLMFFLQTVMWRRRRRRNSRSCWKWRRGYSCRWRHTTRWADPARDKQL